MAYRARRIMRRTSLAPVSKPLPVTRPSKVGYVDETLSKKRRSEPWSIGGMRTKISILLFFGQVNEVISIGHPINK